jgi:hypothetical protein
MGFGKQPSRSRIGEKCGDHGGGDTVFFGLYGSFD